MVIFASEDISNADPRALQIAIAVKDAVEFVGLPEGVIPLAQGVTYLASAPKSNASLLALSKAREDVREFGALPVPLHLRNAPTPLMRELGYGKEYRYPHEYEGALVAEDYAPDEVKGRTYYQPSDRGYESRIKEYLARAREMRKRARVTAKRDADAKK
jgi:putative ATPase